VLNICLIFQQPIIRNRVTVEELQWIICWMLDHSPVQSGKETTRQLQFQTIEQAYENYVNDTKQRTTFVVRSKSFFLKWIHSLDVRLPSFSRYVCPICSSGDEVQIFQYQLTINLYLKGVIFLGQEKSTSKTYNYTTRSIQSTN
jgi:hypothetical protein